MRPGAAGPGSALLAGGLFDDLDGALRGAPDRLRLGTLGALSKDLLGELSRGARSARRHALSFRPVALRR